MIKSLIAFGGDRDKLNAVFDPKSLADKFPYINSHMIKFHCNNNYDIYFKMDHTGEFWDCVNEEIWYRDIIPVLEKNDFSWINITIDSELDDSVEFCSFEGNNGTDNNLLETFYVKTDIVSNVLI